MRENRPLPDRIANAPSLLPGLELYYGAFMDLMATRRFGDMGGISPIGWDVVQYYGVSNGFNADQMEALHYHVKTLDSRYIAHYTKKNSKSNKAMKG